MTLRRTGSWPRKVPLRSNLPLSSRSRLSSNGRLKRTPFVAKAPKGTSEEKTAKKVVKARSGLICEGCANRRASDFSHRVNEGQGGPWVASNGLHLCRPCHNWIGNNLREARAKGWYLRSHENFRTIPVQHAWLGRVLLHDDGTTRRLEEVA